MLAFIDIFLDYDDDDDDAWGLVAYGDLLLLTLISAVIYDQCLLCDCITSGPVRALGL